MGLSKDKKYSKYLQNRHLIFVHQSIIFSSMYVGTVLTSNKLWTSIPTNRSKIAAIWVLLTTLSADNNTVCCDDTVNSTRLIQRQLPHWTRHMSWRDGENSHKRNVQFRKQTTNKPKLWYNRSKRINKQITDILCSIRRKKSAASRFDCTCGHWTSQVTKLKLSHLSPTKCYLKIGGKAKWTNESQKWVLQKNKFNPFTQYKSHVRFQTQFHQ